MKKNYFTVLSIILLFCCNIFSINRTFAKADPTPITIQVFLEPPYPLELAAYLELDERLIVNVTNTSSESQNIKLALTINGPGGLTLPSQSAMDEPLVLAAGETKSFTGGEIQDMIDINEDDVEYGEYSRDDIINSGMLPEGDYTICAAAFDFDTDQRLSAGAPDDCYDFALNYAERPEIISPDHESTLSDVEINPLIVSWSDPAYALYGDEDIEIEYRLEMIDLADVDYPGTPLEGLFEPGAPLFYDETVEASGSGFTSYNIEDEEFEQGHSYAVRVTANDLNNHIAYRNGGHSEVHVFTVSGDNGSCSVTDPDFDFQVENIYPTDHDTLPFSFIPCVIEITPHCENYTNFTYHHIAVEDSEPPAPSYDRPVVDIWPQGPRDYLVNHIGAEEPVGDRPWQFITNLRDPQESSMPLMRGKRYDWTVISPTVQVGAESAVADDLREDYVYGMTKPVLSVPENEDTLAPGDINFGFNKGTAPDNLLPETVKLLAVDRGEVEGAQNIGNVRERWVLQVATTQEFHPDDIVFGTTGLVDASSDLNEDDIRETVYGSESLNNEFTEEGDYWWRVIWLKNPEMDIPENHFISNEDFYLSSPVWKFTIHAGSSGGGEEEEEEEPVAGCLNQCEYEGDISTDDISSLEVNDTVKVGQFKMVVTEISQSGHNFTGEGKIKLPFFNDKYLLVQFENIKVNTDNRLYNGTITGREKETCEFLDEITNTTGEIPALADSSLVDDLEDWIDNAGQLLSNLTDDEEVGIPFGIDTEYDDGQPIVLGVVNTVFEPRHATLSAIAMVGIEQISTTLGFGAQVCFNPHGLTNDSTMFYLPADYHIPYGEGANEFGIDLKGGEPDDWENICHVKFGCDMKFISAQIAIEADLPRETFVPVDEDGHMSEDEDEYVKVSGKVRVTSPKNLLIGLSIDPFYIAGSDMFHYEAENAWLDLSVEANPPGLEFPSNYHHASMDDGDMRDTWKGFYMQTIGAHATGDIWQYSDDLNVSFQNLIIDASGVTFNFGVYDILDEDDATIAEWQATLDTIELQVAESNFDKFNVAGRILPPMADDGQWMNYRVVLDLPDAHSSSSGGGSGGSSSGSGSSGGSGGSHDDHSSDRGNYFMEVNVEDSINVSVWVATMKFYDNSYIRLGVDDDGAYIRCILNGKINIEDENADEDRRSSIPEMNMTGIEFDSLWISSRRNDEGQYISCAHFGFASPQKSVSGFPVSISDFELGSTDGLDGFYLGFDLSLSLNQNHDSDDDSEGDSEENNSFSITAGLRLNASYSTREHGGGREFAFEGVSLTSIEIEADFSEIYLHGLLEWEKTTEVEQIHGLLEVGLPMGIGCKIEAIFGTYKNSSLDNPVYNTNNYYDYWYVYGNVNLGSSGITIGPAVALYAFGGGVYHHMRLKPEYLDDAVVVSEIYNPDAEKDEDGNAIGSTDALNANDLFERDYDTFLGFRINALIATSGNSSVANFEVGVLAQFSNSGGLNLLKIDGAVYVMQEMASGDGEGKLWGTADITYSNYPETGKQLDGTVEIYLNLGNVLVGGIDEHYKMVDAHFFAGNDDEYGEDIWYFHLGSYSPATGIEPGAAIKLQIGDIDLAEVKAYMMIGYGIPQHLPPPPDKIAALVGMDSQNRNGQSAETEDPDIDSDVDYASMQRGGVSQDKLFDGTGFAFGAVLEVDAGWDAFIYFDLYVGIGFDLIMTRFDEGIECDGFPDPGINRWYAQGQAYAGLSGELGVQFKFFGEHKIPLLSLGLGLYMKAYFPNPNYFEGRGGVHFSVLGGLIEGHKTFTIQKGEPCQLVIKDPLANINIIEDVEPDGTNESVFSKPSVLFNFSMDRRLIIPRTIDSETGRISSYYRFKPSVYDFSVINTSTVAEKPGHDEYKNNRKILKRKPANAFLGNTEYSINCEVRMKDYTRYHDYTANGDWYMQDGQIWKEDTTVVFTTGDYPDVIPLENVKYSYPFNNQRFFLQAEGNRKGTIRLFTGMGEEGGEGGLFYTEGDNGITYSYVARFINIEDENAIEHVLESPINYSGGEWVLFDIPQLENEKIYYCQIIRKTHFPVVSSVALGIMNNAGGSSTGLNNNFSARPMLLRDIFRSSTGYATMKVDTLGPDDFIDENVEKRLYDFYFRTSKFNRMTDKLRGVATEGRTPGSRDDAAKLKADIEIKNAGESFEDYELKTQSYIVDGQRVRIDPLYKFLDKYESSSYWNEKSGIYNSYQTIIDYGRYTSLCKGRYSDDCPEEGITDRKYYKPSVPGILRFNAPPSKNLYIGVDHKNISLSPLSEDEIEDGWAINWEMSGPTYNMMSFSGTYGNGSSSSTMMMSSFSMSDVFYVPADDKILLSYSLPNAMFQRNEDWQEYINDFFYSRRGRVSDYNGTNRVRSYSNFELDHPLSSYIHEENINVYSTYTYILGRRASDYSFYTENQYVDDGEFGGHWIFSTYNMDIRFNPPLPEEYKRHSTHKNIFYRINEDNSRYRTTLY